MGLKNKLTKSSGAPGSLLGKEPPTTPPNPHPALNHHLRKGKACQSPNLKCSVHSEVCQLQTEGSVSWEPKGTRKGGSSKPNDPTPQTKTGANGGTPGFSKDLIESIQSPQKKKKKSPPVITIPPCEKGRGNKEKIKERKVLFKKIGTFMFQLGSSDADLARLRPHPLPFSRRLLSTLWLGWG